MAKLKADWLKEAKSLGLDVSDKDKVAAIKAAVETAQQAEPKPKEPKEASKLAKAGKRSKKGLEEAEVKADKEARKRGELKEEPQKEAEVVKKGPVPVTRPKSERRSNRYQAQAKKIDKNKEYGLAEATALAVDTSNVKFDATLELHVRLNADPKQADQNIRDTVSLPHGTGKTLRVAVFAADSDQAKAKDAGADLVGDKDLLDKIAKEELDFDVLIATPDLMSQLGKFAKLLGPKGLMPNPKSGTVTKNVAAAVKQAKAGQVEFRIDKQGIVHVAAGKVSFGQDKLLANTQAILNAIKAAKPAGIKGQYVQSAYLSTSMGPSIRLAPADIFSQPAAK